MGTDLDVCVTTVVKAGTGEPREEYQGRSGMEGLNHGFIAVIESLTFLRECIRRSIQSSFTKDVIPYSTLSDFEHQLRNTSPDLVLLSSTDAGANSCARAVKVLSDLVPGSAVVVLGLADDLDMARRAIRSGARGYIPCTMEFEIAMEALRFVLVGGTYVPPDYLLSTGRPERETSQNVFPARAITRRELAVIRAIQKGRSNRDIAYQLSLRESTVKVHVRNVMKKMQAKNRTEIAIKAQVLLDNAGSAINTGAADQAA